MPATRKRRARSRTPETIPCVVTVSRGGVQISIEHIMLADAGRVACYLLGQLETHKDRFPELERPMYVEHFGGYTVVPATDDETLARKRPGRVGF